MKQAIKIGADALDLDEGVEFSVTKRVANIGTLERQSSFINKLDVPATANNLRLVGLVQGSDESQLKYTRQIGSVVSNGIEVMSQAEIMAQQVDNRISLLINGDNSLFVDNVSKTKLRDIDLSELDHVWNKANVFGSRLNTWEDGLMYAIHDSGNQSRQNNVLQCQGIVPQVFAKYLFDKIAAHFGYTFEGAFWNHPMFDKIVCFIVEARTGQRIQNQVKVTADKTTNQTYTGIFNYYTPVTNWDSVTTDTWSVWNVNRAWAYEIKFPGTYTFKASFTSLVAKGIPANSDNIVRAKYRLICFKVSGGSTTILSEQFVQTTSLGGYDNEITIDVKLEDYIVNSQNSGVYVQLQVYQEQSPIESPGIPFYNTKITITNASLWVDFIDADNSHYNRPISIQDSLPDWTCGNFIKQVCNLAGVVPIVNEYDKKIRLMMLKELNDNKVNSYKWQAKMDTSNPIQYSFKFDGLAKVMRFVYKEDDRFNYSLNVSNEQLSEQVDYIKSDFMYSAPVFIMGQSFESVTFNLWDKEKGLIKWDKIPRIALLRTEDTHPSYSSPNEVGSSDPTNPSQWAYFRKSDNTYGLDWETLFTEFFQTILNGMTDGTLRIETKFRLDEFDVAEFDWSRPIYLNNPSGYYFAQQIKDFTSSSESTPVEMVRIG